MKRYLKPVFAAISVVDYSDAESKLKSLKDGDTVQYTGNKLGGILEAVADALEVGDEFTVTAEGPIIAPGPDSGRTTRTTTFVVTDKYKYGNGYAPVYRGRYPKLNANESRSWKSISDGALWLTVKSDFEIVIHKQHRG